MNIGKFICQQPQKRCGQTTSAAAQWKTLALWRNPLSTAENPEFGSGRGLFGGGGAGADQERVHRRLGPAP